MTFALQDNTQPAEPHRSGQNCCSLAQSIVDIASVDSEVLLKWSQEVSGLQGGFNYRGPMVFSRNWFQRTIVGGACVLGSNRKCSWSKGVLAYSASSKSAATINLNESLKNMVLIGYLGRFGGKKCDSGNEVM